MLGEVEQVCDRVAIIDKGRLIREGRVNDLLAEGSVLRLEVSSATAAATLLSDYQTVTENDTQLVITADREQTSAILGQLLAADIAIYQVTTVRRRLEDVFLRALKEESDA
jgi:ABC-2 type transport system ATP-binding protein